MLSAAGQPHRVCMSRAIGLALASGADYPSAIRLANVAGGLEVEKIGVATVTRDEIVRDLLGRTRAPTGMDGKELTGWEGR